MPHIARFVPSGGRPRNVVPASYKYTGHPKSKLPSRWPHRQQQNPYYFDTLSEFEDVDQGSAPPFLSDPVSSIQWQKLPPKRVDVNKSTPGPPVKFPQVQSKVENRTEVVKFPQVRSPQKFQNTLPPTERKFAIPEVVNSTPSAETSNVFGGSTVLGSIVDKVGEMMDKHNADEKNMEAGDKRSEKIYVPFIIALPSDQRYSNNNTTQPQNSATGNVNFTEQYQQLLSSSEVTKMMLQGLIENLEHLSKMLELQFMANRIMMGSKY